MGSGPAVSAGSGNLLETQNLRFYLTRKHRRLSQFCGCWLRTQDPCWKQGASFLTAWKVSWTSRSHLFPWSFNSSESIAEVAKFVSVSDHKMWRNARDLWSFCQQSVKTSTLFQQLALCHHSLGQGHCLLPFLSLPRAWYTSWMFMSIEILV